MCFRTDFHWASLSLQCLTERKARATPGTNTTSGAEVPDARPKKVMTMCAHLRAVMQAEDGAHEVRERMVAKVRRHVRDAQALAARHRPACWVRQLRRPHAAGGDGAELRVLLGDGQRQLSTERVCHRMKGLHRRQPPHLQVVAHLWQAQHSRYQHLGEQEHFDDSYGRCGTAFVSPISSKASADIPGWC